ncbi:MAG: RNA 2',3'-cyclic phosphodiesterase [Candidatus Thorarchaeota archaeon]
MIRAFLAMELKDQETIKEIALFTTRLRQNQPKLKLVEPQNLHITVKFLGDISESLAPKIYKIIQEDINEKVFKGQSYEYFLKGAGQFNKFSVLWIKLNGDINFLQKVKDNTEKSLNEKLNIEFDKRTTFKPHLTIGRLKNNKINYKTFNTFKKLIQDARNLEFGTFRINQLKLKKSVLTPKGPIYSDLVY